MKIKKLKLLEETKTHYIFEVTYNKGYWSLDSLRTAVKEKDSSLSKWADTGEIIYNDSAINAWLSTNKETFVI